ncbi:MAG TPA: hypothetical protein VFV89_08510 [Nocardioides sp.]|nr:hypothetical protein [Nocardioides sp.]
MALLEAAVLVVMPLFAIVGFLGATIFGPHSAAATPWSRTLRLCRVAALSATAGGAAAGLVALLGIPGLLVVIVVAATSPGALRTCRHGLRSVRRPTPGQLDSLARSFAYANPMFVPSEPTIDLRLLTDDQLRHAWQDSEAAIASPPTARALLCAIEVRGQYLDEIERRQPSLPKAWLSSRAGAPGSALPYAAAASLESPTIDWDELIGGQASDR